MYNTPEFSPVKGKSIIENIKDRWLTYQFEGNNNKADHSVIFSDGGQYYSEELRNRVSMLNQMQAVTRTINQDISYVLLDLNSISGSN